MAYSIDGFYVDQRGAGHRIHTYTSTDASLVVGASGYFDSLASILTAGDTIQCLNSTDNIVYILQVVAISAADVVTTSPVSSISGTAIAGSGATVTLTEAEAGVPILMDRAAGIIFDLPVPRVGLKFTFIVTVDLTAAAYQVDTDAGTTLLVGAVFGAIEAAATGEMHFANGTTHIGLSMNKTTTGGLIGGILEFECISATLWKVSGVTSCTATPLTPFTT